jgi:hypothetical protein
LRAIYRLGCFNAFIPSIAEHHATRNAQMHAIVYLHASKHLKSGHQTWPHRYLFSETTTTASATSQIIKKPPEAEMHWPDIASQPANYPGHIVHSPHTMLHCRRFELILDNVLRHVI